MKKLLTFLFHIILFFNIYAQDCKLYELNITKLDCDSSKYFKVKIDFLHQNTSSCFTVKGNGITYGTFEYTQLPITLDSLKGDCHTEYEFVIEDCEKHDCRVAKELGKVCCEPKPDCKISELQFEKTACNDEKNFYVFLKFNYQGTSECFRVQGNGNSYGEFKYSQLPIKLGPFKGDCTTNYEFVVIDCLNEHCYAAVNVGKVCCETKPDCKISELQFEKTACNDEKNFYVFLKFNYQGTSECFRVKGNGHSYGEFKYSQLPIKLGPFKGDCTTNYEFVVVDCLNEHCNAAVNVGKVCCETKPDCKISELQFEKTACNDEKNFYVFLKFKYQGTSECFRVKGNGHSYGEFKYSQLPIKLGPFKGDCSTNYEFVVIDCVNEHCSAEINVGKVCCETKPDCKISELQFEKTACNDEKNFYVFLKFNYQGTSDCFRVKGNGHSYGEFKYSQLPIKLGPFKGDCSTNYEFVVIDCVNENCNVSVNVGKVCCDTSTCKLAELSIKKSDCDSLKRMFLTISFDAKNTTDSFYLQIPGLVNPTLYSYSQLPLKLGPFETNCNKEYEILVKDYKKLDCKISKSIGKLCCEQSITCKISDLTAIALDCTGPDQYSVKINFKHQGTKGLGFDVWSRGTFLGFYPYTSLPLLLQEFKASGHDFDHIKVCENDRPDCCADIEFPALNCFRGGIFDLNQLKIYSISSNTIKVSSSNVIPQNISYEIYSLDGRKIGFTTGSISDYSQLIQSTNLHSGLYIIRFLWSNQNKDFCIYIN